MASMKDISKVCGVSVATVSKALNDHSDIGEETKANIRETAKKLGYFPNIAARSLKTRRSYNLGVLFVDDARSGLTHDFFANVLDSFKSYAEAEGYDITFINCSKEKKDNMTFLEHAKYRGVDGVVIACIDFENPEVMELIKGDLPVVTVDYVFDSRTAIVSDNVAGMRELVKYIISQGHKKIAYIHGRESSVTRARLSSFFNVLSEHEIEIPNDYIVECDYRNIEESYVATKKLIDLKDRPTCILYPDDYALFGGINALSEYELRIGKDISIAGYDGISIGRHLKPTITTIRQNTKEIGVKAAESLIKNIENPKSYLPERIVVEGDLYTGGTVGKI